MKALHRIALGCALALTAQASQAAIGLDRTRAIFDGHEKAISLNIRNDNPRLPYLAQAWLEDLQGERISGPLMAVPPVQRVEPGAKSQIRISSLPDIAKLPQDRESVFYFNVREIPPRSEKPNVMQVALQTKIKLFYRPEAITPAQNDIWQEKLVLTQTGNGYKIENPTPYYVTVIGLSGAAKDAGKAFKTVMIEPKSSVNVASGHYATPYLSYINDYGGRPALKFVCAGAVCHAQHEQV